MMHVVRIEVCKGRLRWGSMVQECWDQVEAI